MAAPEAGAVELFQLLIDHQIRESWKLAGSRDLHAKACEKARHLLETQEPQPLSDSTLAGLPAIATSAEEERGFRWAQD